MPARLHLLLPLLLLLTPADAADAPTTLPNSRPLELDRPLWEKMVDGLDRFCLAEIEKSVERRARHWKRDDSTHEAYEKSVEPNRRRLRTIIGAVDERVSQPTLDVLHELGSMAAWKDGRASHFNVSYVRWNVLRGVTGEGLLLQPSGTPKARVVALPDAAWTPELFVGFPKTPVPMHEGRPVDSDPAGPPPQRSPTMLPARLALDGCQVLVPTLISRDCTFSGRAGVAFTNQPHREWVYRPAFQMGRHVVGYEVQKVLAGIDAFDVLDREAKPDVSSFDDASNANETSEDRGMIGPLPVAICGIGEGGRIAMLAAAIDERIDVCLVSGHFGPREGVWREPIDRNVWRLLDEFGDAEIGSLIAPRRLVVEAAAAPEFGGPPPPEKGRRGGAAPGRITNFDLDDVEREVDRLAELVAELNAPAAVTLLPNDEGNGRPGSSAAARVVLDSLGVEAHDWALDRVGLRGPPQPLSKPGAERSRATVPKHPRFDPIARQGRQVAELTAFTQNLLRDSDRVRYEFWKNADRGRSKTFTPEEWKAHAETYREYVHDEMIGRLPESTMPLNPRSRKMIDEPTHTGYEVVLDVYPDVIAGGILLLPKDLAEGERRPVVVCQHGLEGTPMDTITTDESSRAWRAYKGFATRLVKRGFVVYAPQNPYRGGDRFRTLQRKSNPLGRSLFSYIVRQHERTLEWLADQPFVDADRIGFYGLSYGGKTAMRVPALLPPRTLDDGTRKPGYCLSICSADFNEWIRKCVTDRARYSYVFTGEYEMFEWNMGHVANYAELASLISPRPFMVERGHDDGVAPDEWVAWEYAKVRRHYAKLGIPERTEIEWFDGPHTINAEGTFAFLHRHLDWPEP